MLYKYMAYGHGMKSSWQRAVTDRSKIMSCCLIAVLRATDNNDVFTQQNTVS